MLKKSIALALATLSLSSAVMASNAVPGATLKCEPPVVTVPSLQEGVSLYSVDCQGSNKLALSPKVVFSGEVNAHGTAPYDIQATYRIDIQPMMARVSGERPAEDQVFVGRLRASTVSVASLPTQFANQSVWDEGFGVLSIEETSGKWRVFSIRGDAAAADARLSDAGVASTPMKGGLAHASLTFDRVFSRFAGKGGDLPVMKAALGMRDGKLEVLLGETLTTGLPALQGALLSLDRKPKDMARAWNLAARAQFLGESGMVRYAEQKVAAHNPQLLEEFQLNIDRIKPFELPNQ